MHIDIQSVTPHPIIHKDPGIYIHQRVVLVKTDLSILTRSTQSYKYLPKIHFELRPSLKIITDNVLFPLHKTANLTILSLRGL